MTTFSSVAFRNIANGLVVALVASVLAVMPPVTNRASAANTIDQIADGVCDLTGGSGATSYTIATAWELWETVDCDGANKLFSLGADIALDGVLNAPTSSPIGTSTSGVLSFSGSLDGNGKSITGIEISTSEIGAGLFGFLESATVSNLSLFGSVSAVITQSNPPTFIDWGTGALAGGAIGAITVTSVSSRVDVKGKLYVGGLIGFADAALTISDVINHGDVSGDRGVGGLVGYISNLADQAGATSVSVTRGKNTGAISASRQGQAGGLIGKSLGPADISFSENSGSVHSVDEAGGLIGTQYNRVKILKSRNTGSISSQFSMASGLIADAWTSQPVSVSESENVGLISGGGYVGGLIGWVRNVFIENSRNAGNISSSGTSPNLGGLIADSGGDVQISASYVSGQLSTTSQASDAVVGYASPSNVALTSVFTSVEPSSYLSVSPIPALRTSATFVGWDFTGIWGFPSCSVGNGLPVLRSFSDGLVLSSVGCLDADNLIAQSQNAGNQGGSGSGSTSSPNTDPTSYRGPKLQPLAEGVLAGAQVTFEGTKLDSVNRAIVSSLELVIVSKTSTTLVVVLPATLSSGRYDIDVYSEFGRLTLLSAFTIKSVTPAPFPDLGPTESQKAELIGWMWSLRFDGNSRVANSGQEQALEANLARFADTKTVVCWGYTASLNPNDWAIAHATARAQALCDLVAAKMSVKTAVRLSYGAPRPHALRASLQFWR